ncbi:hypothetical protein [Streptomyces sp. NPDC056682]|uniref:hypothetical protein n=1 Tax=Streptomyces sp. NPDC056682 TaxID=3345909 RepID=UPI0036ADF0A1
MPTVLIGSQNSVKTGYKSSQGTDQYGPLRTFDQSLGLAPLTNHDRYAATANDAWRVGPQSTNQSQEPGTPEAASTVLRTVRGTAGGAVVG